MYARRRTVRRLTVLVHEAIFTSIQLLRFQLPTIRLSKSFTFILCIKEAPFPRNEMTTVLDQDDCRDRGKGGSHSCLPSNQTLGDNNSNHYIKHFVVCLCGVGGGGKPVNRRHSANHMIPTTADNKKHWRRALSPFQILHQQDKAITGVPHIMTAFNMTVQDQFISSHHC